MLLPEITTEKAQRLIGMIEAAELPIRVPVCALSRAAEELLCRRGGAGPAGKSVRKLEALAARLDATFPGWPEAGAAVVLTRMTQDANLVHAIACLLALRPLTFHLPLCKALLQPAETMHREFAALALLGTDTAQVRNVTDLAFDLLSNQHFAIDSIEARTLWLLFARLAQEKRLSYTDFRRVAITVQLLQPEGYPDETSQIKKQKRTGRFSLHPCLDRAGLSELPEFRRLYFMLVAELVPVLEAPVPWNALRWIRCFPGGDYFWDALGGIAQKPYDLTSLFVLRWAQEVGEEQDEFPLHLAAFPPFAQMLAALLRPDLAHRVGEVFNTPELPLVLEWLGRPCREAAEDSTLINDVVAPWVGLHFSTLGDAVGILCAVALPEAEPWPARLEGAPEVARTEHFIGLHLLAGFHNVMDNMLLLQGICGKEVVRLEESASIGRLAAIRALGLVETAAETSIRVLLKLADSGSEPQRRAAQWSLQQITARYNLADLEELRAKLDLAAAWQDGGLTHAPARVWWDIAGHRVKLSLAAGKVEVSAWGPARKKAIPAKVRAHPQFREVLEARAALLHSYTIFRKRLEEAMLAGTQLPGGRFRALFANPAFRSLVQRLVLCDGKDYLRLEVPEGEKANAQLDKLAGARVVHPVELWQMGQLEKWQEVIANGMISQPFKQCFREIYPVETGEADSRHCLRFAEQQIVARKAYALLRQRGYSPCSGTAYRDWPAAKVRVRIVWAQEEGEIWRHLSGGREAAPVTTGSIFFERLDPAHPRKAGETLALGEVNAIIFSETLRDADLVVSAAAAGEEGFSSRQTLEIRAALVRNFAKLMNLAGVTVATGSSQAVIQGERAAYRVHLGSGRILIDPSGRHVALPREVGGVTMNYFDEQSDSRTLAILEAVATLAHDREIDDPHFLAALATG
jgi:hypothetical protein